MPTLTDTLKNGVPRAILRSPAHRLMSARYATLEFNGRTSGQPYAVPVAYVESGDTLLVSTDSRWWRNLVDGRHFAVRLRGDLRPATARRLEGAPAHAALEALVRIPGYARAAGLERVDGAVTQDALLRATRERCVLAISLVDGGPEPGLTPSSVAAADR